MTPRLLSATQGPQFPFYTLLVSGGHTLLVQSFSLTDHKILSETEDTAVGDYIDKVARSLEVTWDNRMPGAALEEWSQLNQVDDEILAVDVECWQLPKPFFKNGKRVGFSFSGLRSAVDRIVLRDVQMSEEERKSLGRAAQLMGFQHIAEKCVLGIKNRSNHPCQSTMVVSGGVASNTTFRKMYATLQSELIVDCVKPSTNLDLRDTKLCFRLWNIVRITQR